jgi:hypothetical protein
MSAWTHEDVESVVFTITWCVFLLMVAYFWIFT